MQSSSPPPRDIHTLSNDEKRNKIYHAFLKYHREKNITVVDIVKLGYEVMEKAKIHPHFVTGHSLLTVALNLSFFYLKLPYEYNNPDFLNKKISEADAVSIIQLFERRISERIPVEYITHETYYLGHKFYVDERVLVPRSLMNTQFRDFLNRVRWENYRVLDLCTGSGCIGITLALLNPEIRVDLVDISEAALQVAQMNINHYALQDRIRCIQSDLFENISGKYDLIISNPPYVSDREYQGQALEVKHEPAIALRGGVEGLDLVTKLLFQAKSYLNRNGLLIVEVGYSVAKLLKKKYPHVPLQWAKYREPNGYESLVDKIIRWGGFLDSIFICESSQLPS